MAALAGGAVVAAGVAVATVLGNGGSDGQPSGGTHGGRGGGVAAACPATVPNRKSPPTRDLGALAHGGHDLWVALPTTTGTLAVDDVVTSGVGLRRDGSIQWKYPWYRGPNAGRQIRITVREVGPRRRAGHAIVTSPRRGTWGWATYVFYPASGCWRVSARAGRADVSFVVRVVLRHVR
jgi:hypothetical protein